MTTRYKMHYCAECGQTTKHRYEGMNWFVALLLFLMTMWPFFIYLWWAIRRADRTLTCTNDHIAMREAKQRAEDERMAALVARAVAASNGNVAPLPAKPKRGTGFMTRG